MRLRNLILPILLCFSLTACSSAEEKAQAHYERGLELLAEGDDDRALLEFRNALREMETFMDARLEVARLSRKAGADQIAFRDYRRIAEQDPSNLEANIALSEMSFLSRNWEIFEIYSEDAVALAPQDPAVQAIDLAARYRTATLAGNGLARSAIVVEAEALEEVIPDSPVLRQLLIDGYLFETRFAKALEQLDKAISADPKVFDFYMLRLQLLAQIGDQEGLERELINMVRVFPEDENMRINLLRYYVSQDKIDEAEVYLRERVAEAPEGETEPLITLVRFLLELGDQETALAALNAAIGENPKVYSLRILQASLVFDSGAQNEAIEDVQNILEEAKAEGEALDESELHSIKVLLASMLSNTGNEVGARRLVEEVLETNPSVVAALKMQARWMIADDDTDGAINALRIALASAEQDYEAMTLMAAAYERAGQKDLMLDFLSLAARTSNDAPEYALRYAAALRSDGKLQQAETVLVSALRNESTNVDILGALGQVYLDTLDDARARQVITALTQIGTEQAQSVKAGIELTLLQREAGNDSAIAYLETLAAEHEGKLGVSLTLIQAHMRNGESTKALELVNTLITENPDSLILIYFRGLNEAILGNIDKSIETFADLTQRSPQSADSWIQLARMQTISEAPEVVLKTFDDGLAANPASVEILWAKASYLEAQGDIDGAIAIYEDLYEQNSGSMILANNLASMLSTHRLDDESLQRARTIARRLNGTQIPPLQDTYGWILHRAGKSEEALPYLEAAAAALTEDPFVQFHLGEVYNTLGRREEALAQMRLAREKIGPLDSTTLGDRIQERMMTLEAPPEN